MGGLPWRKVIGKHSPWRLTSLGRSYSPNRTRFRLSPTFDTVHKCFTGKMKHYRRIFSRFGKLADRYLRFLQFV